jgi:teichoic acid transport system ATP-binding protein
VADQDRAQAANTRAEADSRVNGQGGGASSPTAAHDRPSERASEAPPTVIVDDLHIVYRVYGAGGTRGNAPAAFRRILKRQKSPNVREVHAIRGISFTAHRGESIGLIGRNGSGKSTLLRAIAGLLPPTRGAVYTDGQPTLLGVNAALMSDLTGERNIILGCLAMGMTPAQAREHYDDIVEFSGLGDFIDLPMRTYSSGMAQRLRFAIAAVKSHDVLMIDEALATGDAEFRRRSEERIRQLREEAGTVFLVSHSLDVVTQTCTRAIWLDKGIIKMDGDADTVVKAYTKATAR